MRQRVITGILTAGLTASLAAACAPDERPNVVLITLDTTRADHIGAYGDPDARTPVLDGLAARGALFERAFSGVPLTLPAHTTILTGLSPDLHGIHDNGRFVVPEAIETVAERLAARGYATGAFVSAFVLDASFGLDRGFDVYEDETHAIHNPLNSVVPSRPGEETTDGALAWLADRGRGPFLLWAHYYDPHAPQRPPPPFDAMGDDYAGEIAYMDSQIGRLLEGVEATAGGRETLILVLADHGESLGEHEEPTHGVVAYDSTLRVPLIAVGPGFEPGTRSRAFVTTEDVTPTILATLGLPAAGKSRGVPLQHMLEEDANGERIAYFESMGPFYGLGWARVSGVRNARWKYTARPDPLELYDVTADPAELQNRIGEEPEIAARLAAQHAAMTADEGAGPAEAAPLSPEAEEQLAALGYLTTPRDFGPGEAPDPRHGVKLLGLVRLAANLAQRPGWLANSIEALTLLSEEETVGTIALRELARIYAVADRHADAIASYEALLELTNATEARVSLAKVLLAEGRPEEAGQVLEAVAAGPGGVPVTVELLRGRVWLQLGRLDEAAQTAESVLARDPAHDGALALASWVRTAREGPGAEIVRLQALFENPPSDPARLTDTRSVLATLLLREGRDAEAVRVLEALESPPPGYYARLAEIAAEHDNQPKAAEHYEAFLQRVPASTEARRALADLYDELGRTEEAIGLYDELVAVDPEDMTLRVDRGAALQRVGRGEEAEADYRVALATDDGIPEAAFNLGLLELAQGRDAEAEQHLLRAVELRPDYAKSHFHLARLYRRRGDPRAALHAERAARTSGGDAAGLPALPTVSEGPAPESTHAE
jgi:arylsulfatase A-like enzyme/Flp pilus assembly protein TadD